jgi:hypothetical protein
VRRILRHRLVIAGLAVALALGGGVAYAASQSGGNSRGAFVNDVAKRLNVSPQRLTSAIKAAEIDRLNAAVKDGRLTRARADAIERAIEAKGPPFPFGSGRGEYRPPGPLGGRPPFFGPLPLGDRRPLASAAGYLGLSQTALFNELHSGRSLAQIARAGGKSVNGLERAITTAIKSRLDRAVAANRITKAQEQRLLARLSGSLRYLINATPPAFGPRSQRPPGFGRSRPPAPWAQPAPTPHQAPIPHRSPIPPF